VLFEDGILVLTVFVLTATAAYRLLGDSNGGGLGLSDLGWRIGEWGHRGCKFGRWLWLLVILSASFVVAPTVLAPTQTALQQQQQANAAVAPALVPAANAPQFPAGWLRRRGTHQPVFTPVERTPDLVVRLAAGHGDALSGRCISASRDQLDDLIARADEIRTDNLYMLSFQR
jgi:hypothetical protein